MATDARCVENLAGLPAVRVPEPVAVGSAVCSRRRQLQRPWCTAKARELPCTADQNRFDLLCATKELAQDMQTRSMLSTLRLRRSAWYLVGAADVSPFFAYPDEPGMMLVWADADGSGNTMTCKPTSVGAVQLENHGTEAWRVVQQVTLFSSDESATEMSKVDRWETLEPRWKQKSQGWRVSRDSCRRRG